MSKWMVLGLYILKSFRVPQNFSTFSGFLIARDLGREATLLVVLIILKNRSKTPGKTGGVYLQQ